MRRRRLVAATLVAAAMALTALLVSTQLAFVTTTGISMQPRISAGDLVVVARSSSYDVGDVVAYRSDLLDTVVLHRIVDRDGDRFVLQGDNNSWLDPEEPTVAEIVGTEAMHVPGGGRWLDRATSPPVLGLITLTLLASGGTTAQIRRRRRRRAMSSRAARHTSHATALTALPPQLRTAAVVVAGLGVLGVGLGALAWSGPLQSPTTTEQQTDHSMVFSYSADVPRTPVYDGTTATSPDPVFRTLADSVDVRFAYEGQPGTVTVAAELSTPSGWRSTVPLADETTFDTERYADTVTLDLPALQARADAAAEVTEMPANQLRIAVVPAVRTADGATFEPSLALALTPQQLKLEGDAQTLTVDESVTSEQTTSAPRTLGLLGRSITVGTARTVSAALAVGALLAAAVLVLLARRTEPASEGAGIRRRYAPLLVAVQPMPTPQGRPVVDVTEFATLARLAERYGLLVLHWTRSDVETFVVQDEGTTYRYRTGSKAALDLDADPAASTADGTTAPAV